MRMLLDLWIPRDLLSELLPLQVKIDGQYFLIAMPTTRYLLFYGRRHHSVSALKLNFFSKQSEQTHFSLFQWEYNLSFSVHYIRFGLNFFSVTAHHFTFGVTGQTEEAMRHFQTFDKHFTKIRFVGKIWQCMYFQWWCRYCFGAKQLTFCVPRCVHLFIVFNSEKCTSSICQCRGAQTPEGLFTNMV